MHHHIAPRGFVLLVASCALAGAGPVVAQTNVARKAVAPPVLPGATAAADWLKLGVGWWGSSGQSDWDISFGELDAGLFSMGGRSRLEWKDLDSDLVLYQAEVRPWAWLGVSGRYGTGSVEGNNTDSDWISAPLFGLNDSLVSRSTAETHGDVTVYDANILLRLNQWVGLARSSVLVDLVAGYQSHEEDLGDRHGRQGGVPFAGLDSTYDFEWTAWRAGLRGQVPVRSWFRVTGEATALLGVEYEGEGFWNLRDDFKRTPPNFVHEADGGHGFDLQLALEFRPWTRAVIELGYRLVDLTVEDGSDVTFFADGTSGRSELDQVQTRRDGFFATLNLAL